MPIIRELRDTKAKDIPTLKAYLGHLGKVQAVDRTFNFPHSTICNALKIVDQDSTPTAVRKNRRNHSATFLGFLLKYQAARRI